MPSYIFYPALFMPQSTIPPIIKFPIPNPAPVPDNPPSVNDAIQCIILASWTPTPFYYRNVQRENGLPPLLDFTGNDPPFHRENTIDRINLSWYTPFVYYKNLPFIAPFVRSPDDPIPSSPRYPQSIYDRHTQAYSYWPSFYSRLVRTTIYSPAIITPPVVPKTQVNINLYAVRHGMDIEVNNNRDIQSVNQGSTFIFTIKATARRSFPRHVNSADAVVLSIKDSLGNVVVSSSATKEGDIFTFIYQIDSNAPLGPWSIQVIASYQNVIRVSPYSTVFTVI